MIFELWYSKQNNSYLYIPRDENYETKLELEKSLDSGVQLIWTYESKSLFDAMSAYYSYMDWGTYSPEPAWEDVFYD